MSSPTDPSPTGTATTADERRLLAAIELSRSCPPSPSAFSVGAVIVARDGRVLATGYSRETGPTAHAEQVALERLAGAAGPDVARSVPGLPSGPEGITLYSSLEPCSTRSSFPRSCTELILEAGIPRVVYAWREPATFVNCQGARVLAGAGIEVVELERFAPLVREINAHLRGPT